MIHELVTVGNIRTSKNGKSYADFYGENLQIQGCLVPEEIKGLTKGLTIKAVFQTFKKIVPKISTTSQGKEFATIQTLFSISNLNSFTKS